MGAIQEYAIDPSDVTVRVYGEAAVARGTDTWEMADGSKGAALWTDTEWAGSVLKC